MLKKFLKITGLISFFKRIRRLVNYKTTIQINGKKLVTHRLYGAICEVNEPWMINVLKASFKMKSGAFMDVGVNLGQTLMEAKSIDSERLYIGFEPNPSCVMYVEELIKFNGFNNVRLIPVGLFTSDTLLKMDLYYDDITNSGGSVIEDYWLFTNKNPVYRELIVPVNKYESVVKSLGPLEFEILKIDVEGAELEVLQTLTDVIQKKHPIIIIEILSAYSVENEIRYNRQQKIMQWIRENDYRILRIEETENNELKYLEPIDEFDVNYNYNMTNYIFYQISDYESMKMHFGSYLKNGHILTDTKI